MRAGCHVGGIDNALVCILTSINQAARSRGIRIALRGILRPAIVPAHSGLVAVRRRITRRGGEGVGITEGGANRHIVPACPATRRRGYLRAAIGRSRTAIFQQVGFLPIGTGNVDVQISDIGMFHVQSHVIDILHTLDGVAGSVSREGQRGPV